MEPELKMLFDERQAIREAILQLSDSLNNEGIEVLQEQEKQIQILINDIIYDY